MSDTTPEGLRHTSVTPPNREVRDSLGRRRSNIFVTEAPLEANLNLGFIYFIRVVDQDAVKIGYTNIWDGKRLCQIQNAMCMLGRFLRSMPALAKLTSRVVPWNTADQSRSFEVSVARVPGGAEELRRIEAYVFLGPKLCATLENLRRQCVKLGPQFQGPGPIYCVPAGDWPNPK